MRTSGLRTAKHMAAAFHSVLLPVNGLTFSTLSSVHGRLLPISASRSAFEVD